MKNISWDKYLNDIQTLIKIIEQSKFIPKAILTFPKGGLIPATIISHHFDEADVIFDVNAHNINTLLLNKINILVLDDLCDTGRTFLNHYIDHPHSRSACLYHKSHSLFKPHFIVEDELDNDEWVVFPYEKAPEDEKVAIENHINGDIDAYL